MTQITSTPFSVSTPMTFARGRGGDLYGVNGHGRGFRWDGVTANVEQLGITAPASKPSLTASTASPKYYIRGVDIIDGGFGYQKVPNVTFTGGGGSGAAAKAELLGGSVQRISMLDYGSGYTSSPTVSVGEPDGSASGGSGATFSVTASGGLAEVNITAVGAGYTTAPSVTLSGGGGSGAILRTLIDSAGAVVAVEILNPGSGYTSEPTLTLAAAPAGGTTATATATIGYIVTSVSVTAAGSGYSGRPRLTFSSTDGGGAYADCTVGTGGSAGQITSVTVRQGGLYRVKPTATIVVPPALLPRAARLTAVAQPALRGKYWAALRYIDDTTDPIPSSITELAEIELASPAESLSWTWSNTGAEARVDKIELWRTSADQALVLYRVATLSKVAGSLPTTYTDSLSDSDLIDPARTGFGALPIVLPNGQTNARRFEPPPSDKSAVVMFQDRAWYGVDTSGNEPNSLYFSEIDEPESVPDTNEIVVQQNMKGTDQVSALMPFGAALVVFQKRHAYRLSYAAQPVIDSTVTLVAQRGCLNQRCWDTHDGVAYVADSIGVYAFDGNAAIPLSDAVDTFWADNVIHFASSKWCFLRVDPATRIVRFFFSVSAGMPDRALCYHPTTKAWWLEQYAQTIAASECVASGGRNRLAGGGQSGELYLLDEGPLDYTAAGTTTAVACSMRTGNMPLDPKAGDRSIRLLYQPTTANCTLSLALHFNNSATARLSAVRTDRGTGFTSEPGQAATLNLATARSPLGDATGYATCAYAGRIDDSSAGADRHVAINISVTKPAAEGVTLHGIALMGAGQ